NDLRAADAEDLVLRAGPKARDVEPALASTAAHLDRYRGLEALALHLSARREVLFNRFTREWARLEARDFAAALLASISEPEPATTAPTAPAGP
ncbi:MAG: hypothetical protein WKF40_09795, partial [Thermoleophilaceae bacterium]